MNDVISIRTSAFRRNRHLEELLSELNEMLAGPERALLRKFEVPREPLLLIVGTPRSGTTLLLQWLAASAAFGYPTNLISRFYEAPYIGARIQQMLTDKRYAFRDEMAQLDPPDGSGILESELGKTSGILGANEFWYFWRRFWPFGELQQMDELTRARVDADGFCAELAALEFALGKPLAMKAMIAQWHLPLLAEMLERAVFLYVKRHPFFTIQSLLRARAIHLGTPEAWYSFKPPEFVSLANLSPIEQVAGQVFYTTRAIERGLSDLPPRRVIRCSYEAFCANPREVWEHIASLPDLDLPAEQTEYRGATSLRPQCTISVDRENSVQIAEAYYRLSGEDIYPADAVTAQCGGEEVTHAL